MHFNITLIADSSHFKQLFVAIDEDSTYEASVGIKMDIVTNEVEI